MSYYGRGGGYNAPPPQYQNFSGPSGSYDTNSTPANLGLRRNQQIQSIFVAYPKNARPVQSDNSVIDVSINLRNNNLVIFRILLTPNFPISPPTIRLLALCSPYTYLEKNTSNVIHASLQRWDPNCNLGAVCKQIFTQFVNFPPTVIQNNVDPTANLHNLSGPLRQNQGGSVGYPQVGGGSPLPTNPSLPTSYSPSVLSQSTTITPQPVNIPPIPSSFREIERMNKHEVDELLNNRSKLTAFVEKLEYYQDLSIKLESLRTENTNIAKRNKEREYEIKQKTDELNMKKVEIEKLSKIVQDVNMKRMQIQDRYKPKQIVHKLSSLMFEGEKKFAKHSEKFEENGGDVQQFIKEIKKERLLYHIRKLKKEGFEKKFSNQMQ